MSEFIRKISLHVSEMKVSCSTENSGKQNVAFNINLAGYLEYRVSRMISEKCLQLEKPWAFSPGVLKGCIVSPEAFPGMSRQVINYDPGSFRLSVHAGWDKDLSGMSVRISTGESLPLMAVRLLSQTAFNESLPVVQMVFNIPTWDAGTGIVPLKIVNKAVSEITSTEFDNVIRAGRETDQEYRNRGELEESEINFILRKVYRNAPAAVFIDLENSLLNPRNENTIFNLLKAAGYTQVYCAHRFEHIVRLISLAEKSCIRHELIPVIQRHFSLCEKKLGSGSQIMLNLL